MGGLPWKRALVTGASSGIGRALAERLAADGVEHLVVIARRRERLAHLVEQFPCATEVLAVDLCTSDGLKAVQDRCSDIDLLVNNAGVGHFGPFVEQGPEALSAMLQLNCVVPTLLGRTAAAAMVQRGSGAIVNIASGQSYQPMPYMAAYAATKAYMLSWALALREELRGTGVQVNTVCPGATPTEFNQEAGVPEEELGVMNLVTNTVDGVVAATMGAIAQDRAAVIPGLGTGLVTRLGAVAPTAISIPLMGWLLRDAAHQTIKS